MRQRKQQSGQSAQYPSEGEHSRFVHIGSYVAGEQDGTYVPDLERTEREARLGSRHPEAFFECRQHAYSVDPHRDGDKDERGQNESEHLDVGTWLNTSWLASADAVPCALLW